MEIKIHVPFLFWKYRLANTGRYFLHRREIDRMADNQTGKQKIQELTDKLERCLTELFNSDSYKKYLSTMSKFHNYRFNNTFLIAMQKPEAYLVAGYKAWQKNFERHVNKGEKAIRILAPAPYKIKEEINNDSPKTAVKRLIKEYGLSE